MKSSGWAAAVFDAENPLRGQIGLMKQPSRSQVKAGLLFDSLGFANQDRILQRAVERDVDVLVPRFLLASVKWSHVFLRNEFPRGIGYTSSAQDFRVKTELCVAMETPAGVVSVASACSQDEKMCLGRDKEVTVCLFSTVNIPSFSIVMHLGRTNVGTQRKNKNQGCFIHMCVGVIHKTEVLDDC